MEIRFTPAKPKAEAPTHRKLLTAIVCGGLAVVAGAICWALLAYLLERVSLAIAFLIGAGVSLAYAFPFRPMNASKAIILLIPSIVSTLASILLGEFLVAVLLVARELNYSVSDAMGFVASNAARILDPAGIVTALVLGSAGSILGYLYVARSGRQKT